MIGDVHRQHRLDAANEILPYRTYVPTSYTGAKSFPLIVALHPDPTVNVSGSRMMVAKLKDLGTEVTYIEVPGGLHSDVVAPNIAAVIDFFNAHKTTVKSTAQPARPAVPADPVVGCAATIRSAAARIVDAAQSATGAER